ncbi:MAG: hypothetical protein R3212_11105 [Xanthomonadales bacterium]|nr:hypothetical protein [Xanthomonadales bacterium]
MIRSHSIGARIARAALLAVLLFAQGVAAAHQFTHWSHPAHELCATCSLSTHLDAPATACQDVPAVPTSPWITRATAVPVVETSVELPYFQRAPPHSL